MNYVFNLEEQGAGVPAATNELTVVYPVPVQAASGDTIVVTVPKMGDSTSTVCATAVGVSY
jgi:hypothetical protein